MANRIVLMLLVLVEPLALGIFCKCKLRERCGRCGNNFFVYLECVVLADRENVLKWLFANASFQLHNKPDII